MESDLYKDSLIKAMGLAQFNQDFETIKLLAQKEAKESHFKAVEDELDKRTEAQKGSTVLHNGFTIQCGNKGSKLSGG